jgi:hypothetical protein
MNHQRHRPGGFSSVQACGGKVGGGPDSVGDDARERHIRPPSDELRGLIVGGDDARFDRAHGVIRLPDRHVACLDSKDTTLN